MDQLQHFSHVHPLMFKEGEQKNEDGAAASPPVDCSKCGDPVLGPSYSCNQCSELFILHKSCALLPRMMHHPIHRKHLLVLVPDRTNYICDICGNGHSSSFGYTCEQDGFDLDLQCALNLSNTKFLEHFSHRHALMFMEEPKRESKDSLVVCSGCREQVIGPSYCCSLLQCYYTLHKSCAELPREMHHPKHVKHPLVLFSHRDHRCHFCDKLRTNIFSYTCEQCDFELDLQCASNSSDIKCLEHFSHERALMFMEEPKRKSKDSLVVCDGCREQVFGPSYCCSQFHCYYTLHKSCTELPPEFHHPMHIQHPLILNKDRLRKYQCDACNQDCSDRFTYSCFQCDFNLDQNSAFNWTGFKHFSHEHPLLLEREPKKEYIGPRFCDGCQDQILGPSYTCINTFQRRKCGFNLHKKCAELPHEIEHPMHRQHPLFLLNIFQDMKVSHLCIVCNQPCRFLYSCSICDFNLDLRCASNWKSIMGNDTHVHQFMVARKEMDDLHVYCDVLW